MYQSILGSPVTVEETVKLASSPQSSSQKVLGNFLYSSWNLLRNFNLRETAQVFLMSDTTSNVVRVPVRGTTLSWVEYILLPVVQAVRVDVRMRFWADISFPLIDYRSDPEDMYLYLLTTLKVVSLSQSCIFVSLLYLLLLVQ